MKNTAFIICLLCYIVPAFSQKVESQPFIFQVKNLIETLEYLGAPLLQQDKTAIAELIENQGKMEAIQQILDKYTLFGVQINPESRVKVATGGAKRSLLQGGWKTFLIKVENQAGITAKLVVESEQAKRVYDGQICA